MASKANGRTSLQFGTYEVDLSSQEVFRRGVPLHLHGKPFQILALLLERPGDIFTREELQQRLWPDGTFVDFDRNLNTSVKKLRQALGDSAETPVFIETIPRRGYRFIAPVAVSGNGAVHEIRAHAPENALSDSRQANLLRTSGKRLALIAAGLVGLVIVAVAIIKLRPDHPLDVRNMRVTRVTASGKIRNLAISPDGRSLAYALDLGLQQSLWIRDLDGGNALQLLAPDTVNFAGIAFSPDGQFLYLDRSERTNPVFGYLYRMPALGGKVEPLIRDADSPPSFSPDAKQMVYTRGIPPQNKTEVRISDADGRNDHLFVELKGHEVFDGGATWSPDGTTIAVPYYARGDQPKCVLVLLPLNGGKPQEIFSSQSDIGRPLWLSDHKLLVTLRTGGVPGGQLWTISVPDGAAARLTNDLADYSSAIDISRDRKKLVAKSYSLTADLWIAPAGDLSHPVQMTSGEPSPIVVRELDDGRLVMLVAGVESSQPGSQDASDTRGSEGTAVWTMNVDGTHRTRWVGIQDPDWIEPCGKALLVLSRKDGNLSLLRYDGDNPTPKALVSGDISEPSCSPDGTFAYYANASHPEKIHRIASDAGSTGTIADVLGDTIFGHLAISPDGKLLAYPYQRYSPPRVAIAVISTTGGPAIRDFTARGFIDIPHWSPDGRSLQYLVTSDGVTNLWEQPFSGGPAGQITEFKAGEIFDFSWTRDGTHLLLTRGSSNSDVVLIEDPR